MNIFRKKPVTAVNANILITNHCNQNCSFCFANELMTKGKVREMSLTDYVTLLDYLEKNGQKRVYLMGGEPTLHTNFIDIVETSFKRGFEVELFTNANLTKDIEEYLLESSAKISMIHINIGAPAYREGKVDSQINNFVKKIHKKTIVSLETTIWSLKRSNFMLLFEKANEILPFCSVRIGVDGGLISRGGFSLNKNRKIGEIIDSTIEGLVKSKVRGVWLSEVNACMFTEDQSRRFKDYEIVTLNGYGCLSKRAGVDIKTDLGVIRCFGFDSLNGCKLDRDLIKIKWGLDKSMEEETRSLLPVECSICKFYGYKEGQCPGPCLIGRR